jgi:hypothetical protein
MFEFRVRLSLAAGALLWIGVTGVGAQFVEPEARLLYRIDGAAAAEQFGFVSERVADIDGDGVSELIVGAPTSRAMAASGGRAQVFSGADGSPIPGREWVGVTESGFLGASVSDAGDVNGDGVTDLIVGAPGAPFAPSALPGTVFVWSGADGSLIWSRDGESANDHFGIDVDGVGADVDGDGLVDVLVGAENVDGPAGSLAGRAYILSGRDGATIREFDGPAALAILGNGVSGAGDVNGDGDPDIVLAARDAGSRREGQAFVYNAVTGDLVHTLAPAASARQFGYFFTSGIGDVDGDFLPDIYVPDFADATLGPATGRAYVFSGATGELIHEWVGEAAGGGFGIGRGAGDVDGDGHEDMLLCGWTDSSGAPQAGKAFVFSGADGRLVRTITNTVAGDQMGFDAHGLGDVDGDGGPDFALTAPSNGAGVVYVVAGTPLCRADCDGSGGLDFFDFLCFQNRFAAGAVAADCDGSLSLDFFDFLCFQNRFAAGCP